VNPEYWYETVICPECRRQFVPTSAHYANYGDAPNYYSVGTCSQECKTAVESRGRIPRPLPE